MFDRTFLDEALGFLGRQAGPRPRSSAADLLDQLLGQPAEVPGQPAETPAAGVALAEAVTRLRAARLEQGISLEEVHQATGISRGRLSRVENRVEVNPTIGTLDRMAGALGLRLFVTLVEEPKQPEFGAGPRGA